MQNSSTSRNQPNDSSFLSFITCGYYTKRKSSKSPKNKHPDSTGLCGIRCNQSNMVRIELGSTILVKNSSVPMLEVQIEIESDFQEI